MTDKFENIKYWLDNGIDIQKRRIDLTGEIDEDKVTKIRRAISLMIDTNSNNITVLVSSIGGSVYDGFRLYDVLRACKDVDIVTIAEGKVMSIATIIYLAGDIRQAGPNSRFMIHEASVEELEGRNHQIKIEATELDNVNKDMIRLLSDNTKKTEAFWKKEIEYKDKYYSKDKALTLGIVTEDNYGIVK